MRQTVLICAFLLSLLLVGCEKEVPRDGGVYPYGIIEDVKYFTIDTWPGNAWMSASDDWENEQHGGFLPETALETPYRGYWNIYLEGPEYSLFNQKEKYEQLCLEWGIRFDCREVESDALANVPYKYMDHVVYNHGIIGMDLITESDFDTDHTAGSSLADITTIGFGSWEDVFTEPDVYDPSYVIVRMTDLDATMLPRIHPRVGIQITRNPEKAGTYVFQQYIYFADGKVVKRRFKRVWLEEHLALDPTEYIY